MEHAQRRQDKNWLTWLTLLVALFALAVALWRPVGPRGLTGPAGPQGIQGPAGIGRPGPAGHPGRSIIGPRGTPGANAGVRCPQVWPPSNPKVGAIYGLEQIHGGPCGQYKLVPIFGRDPP